MRSSHLKLAVGIATVFVVGGALASSSRADGQGALTALPATTVLFDSNQADDIGELFSGNYELYRMSADGSGRTRLTHNAAYDSWWPRVSPDRTRIVFNRAPAGLHDRDYTKLTTWIMNVDGSGLTEILPSGRHGWVWQGHPEWKPDGTKLVTMGGPNPSNAQIYQVDADGSNPIRITSNGLGGPRGGTNIDPSWSPDGNSILFVGCPADICIDSLYEIYRVNADGTGETRLTNDLTRDHDPYYAPDGSAIAWLRNTIPPLVWGIYRMNPDGSSQTAVIDDGGINSKPGWALDSDAIYFHRTPLGAFGFNVWKIRKDGSGLQEVVLPRPFLYDNEFPSNGIN